MAISFRLMSRDDLPLVHEWHQRPHVVRWWTVRKTFEETEAHYLPQDRLRATRDVRERD